MDNNYSNEITKLAVGKACAALGFKHIQQGALDALSDVVQHYIQSIGVHTRDQAELAQRAAPGIQDVIPSLEIQRPKATNWKELRTFALDVRKKSADSSAASSARWCQPFAFDVPNFPVTGHHSAKDHKYKSDSTNLRDPWIPKHLPSYPQVHTYKRTQLTSSKKRKGTSSKDILSDSKTKLLKIEANNTVIKNAQTSLALIEDSLDSAK